MTCMPFMRCFIARLTACLILLVPIPATAQSLNPDDVLSIRKRTVSDTSPLGMPAGAFLISPGIEITSTWDDNIFRTRNNAVSDMIANTKPALGIQSRWDRHSVFLGTEGDFGFYADNTDLNYKDYGLLASGQYDIAYDTYLMLSAAHAYRHEGRGTLTSAEDGGSSLTSTTDKQNLQFVHELYKAKIKAFAQNEIIDFSDVASTTSPFDNSVSRQNITFGTTLSYDYMPKNGFFISPTFGKTEYELASGTQAKSHGGDVRIGWNFDNARGLNLSLFGGRHFRTYDTGISSTGMNYLGFKLKYDITRLTTLSLTLDDTFNGYSLVNSAGFYRKTRMIDLEHDFTNFISGNVTFGVDDFSYIGSEGRDRDTRLFYGSVGAKYKVSDQIGLRFKLDHERRSSPVFNEEYKDNRAFVSVVFMR